MLTKGDEIIPNMPSVLREVPVMPPPQTPPRKRWTREQVAAAEVSGVFDGEELELINGELINRMPKNWPHVEIFMAVLFWLQSGFGRSFIAGEAPVDVHPADNPTSEPQPDAIVLERELTAYRRAKPQPQDLRLLIEISDTTLAFDLTVKASLYARAMIADYWVLDIKSRRVIVHRDPAPGGYRDVKSYAEHESIAPLAAPQHLFCWSVEMPASDSV